MGKKVKTHTFNGTKYYVDFEPFSAWTDTPEDKYPAIRFADKLGKRQTDLDTLLHESLHACFPFMKEKRVTQCASDIARFLWRLGVRFNGTA
jgi:hypothetical protein